MRQTVLSSNLFHSTPAAFATSVTDIPAFVILLRFSFNQIIYADDARFGAFGSLSPFFDFFVVRVRGSFALDVVGFYTASKI
jgi:hypothetical protein